MRTIDRATAFKRDYKREAKGQHRARLDNDLKPVLVALATDQPLDAKHRDHDLNGDWAGYRECHIKHELLLTASPTPILCGWRGLARIASFSVEFVQLKRPVTMAACRVSV